MKAMDSVKEQKSLFLYIAVENSPLHNSYFHVNDLRLLIWFIPIDTQWTGVKLWMPGQQSRFYGNKIILNIITVLFDLQYTCNVQSATYTCNSMLISLLFLF